MALNAKASLFDSELRLQFQSHVQQRFCGVSVRNGSGTARDQQMLSTANIRCGYGVQNGVHNDRFGYGRIA